jgi:hypothetical protein
MNAKGSRIQLTKQDVFDIMMESTPVSEPCIGENGRDGSSQRDKLLNVRIEAVDLRPGLRIRIAEFWADQEIEVVKNLDPTVFGSVLTIDGSWNRIATDSRGRTSELEVDPGISVAAIGPAQEFRLRLRGGRFHRSISVEISHSVLSGLVVGT